MILMTGCADKVSESSSDNSKVVFVDIDVDTEKIPEIVFMKYTLYNKYASGNEGYEVQFTDRDGDIYCIQDISGDSYYSITQIYDDFRADRLEDKKTGKSCDKSEIDENFGRLCEVCSDKDYEIVKSDFMPDVEYDSVAWYGCYYDKDGEFRVITLHKSEGESLNSNSETANGIYSWFDGILKS
ncbi:MAG: hypothetical protein K2I00_03110 [Ruminococcus sp.]|nr:hypothetical protein [Ruminococcus sp.]